MGFGKLCAVSLQYNILKSKLLTCNIRSGCILMNVIMNVHMRKNGADDELLYPFS